MLEIIRPKNSRPQLRRPGPTLRRPVQKLPEELRKKRNKCVEDIERLAPPRVKRMSPRLMPPRPTLAKLKKLKKKSSRKPQRGDVRTLPTEEILLRSHAITAIRRAITPSSVPSQKSSNSFYDLQRLYKRVPYI